MTNESMGLLDVERGEVTPTPDFQWTRTSMAVVRKVKQKVRLDPGPVCDLGVLIPCSSHLPVFSMLGQMTTS